MNRFEALVSAIGAKQKDLAEELQISPSALNQLVTGKSKYPSAETMERLRSKYRVNPMWLLLGEGEMFLNEQRQEQIQSAKDSIPEAARARLREKENPELAEALELVRKNPKLAKLVQKLGLLGEEELLRLEGYVDGMRG